MTLDQLYNAFLSLWYELIDNENPQNPQLFDEEDSWTDDGDEILGVSLAQNN